MADLSALTCVLVVADRERVGELVAALSDLPQIDVLVSSGGDDTIDLFEARRPAVVVMTASLAVGDTRSLIVTLRAMMAKAEVSIVVIGDDSGPVRTALDALDLAPDRFVTRPLSPKALRFAVTGGLEAVRIVRGGTKRPSQPVLSAADAAVGSVVASIAPRAVGMPGLPPVPPGAALPPRGSGVPLTVHDTPTAASRAALRARWDALADSIAGSDDVEAEAPVPIVIKPRRHALDVPIDDAQLGWQPAGPVAIPVPPPLPPVPPREPTLIIPAVLPPQDADAAGPSQPRTRTLPEDGVVVAARTSSDELWSEPMPIAALIDREARLDGGTLADDRLAPTDELDDPIAPGRVNGGVPMPLDADPYGEDADDAYDAVDLHESTGAPAGPEFLAEPPDPDELDALDEADDDDRETPDALDAFEEPDTRDRYASPQYPPDIQDAPVRPSSSGLPAARPRPLTPPPREYARELRAKMSMMAQRLFRAGETLPPAELGPHHDHRTEIDLAEIDMAPGDEPVLASERARPARDGQDARDARETRDLKDARDGATNPGSWDTAVRERGLADTGPLVRGISDAAMLLAKMFAQGATGRIWFRREAVETIVYFDRGRPVFASSNEPRDRMGELLLREGKITASQYERCQTVVAESGRRMGEILVDFGYLKRRELLPAVRRHVEDLIYSLFGWDRGTYRIAVDAQPSAERIRLSRHPAALVLEGIRRKFDRQTLERLIGSSSTVIEVPDRERLGGIVHQGDLAVEERAALAAFDGQAELAAVARTAGVDLADMLPLAWGLCVLGLASARRSETEAPDEGPTLVGETDLAIDRERVRARWQLVTCADYFALLGVRRDATAFEIRRAYQSARRDFAADCFPGAVRRELAKELDEIAHVLDEAFRVLRDDRLRQTYLANLIDE